MNPQDVEAIAAKLEASAIPRGSLVWIQVDPGEFPGGLPIEDFRQLGEHLRGRFEFVLATRGVTLEQIKDELFGAVSDAELVRALEVARRRPSLQDAAALLRDRFVIFARTK